MGKDQPSEGEREGVRGPAPVPGPAPAAAAGSVDETQARKRRKQEGAVYTHAVITRYIVGQALGGVLKQRFEALRQQHESEATGTDRKALADPNAYDLTALNEPQRKALIRFWEAWQEALKCLRILDPVCGSGALHIETFDQFHALYETSNARLEELRGQRTLFDLDRQILQHNLYGVDLNPEAVQICQLSLWIKTAARDKQLTSLDHTIRKGNSIISDPAVHPKAFDWQAAYPEVFAQGGFDVVVYFRSQPVHCQEPVPLDIPMGFGFPRCSAQSRSAVFSACRWRELPGASCSESALPSGALLHCRPCFPVRTSCREGRPVSGQGAPARSAEAGERRRALGRSCDSAPVFPSSQGRLGTTMPLSSSHLFRSSGIVPSGSCGSKFLYSFPARSD